MYLNPSQVQKSPLPVINEQILLNSLKLQSLLLLDRLDYV